MFAGIVVGTLLLMVVIGAAKGRGQASSPAGACAVQTWLHTCVLRLRKCSTSMTATCWMRASGWANISLTFVPFVRELFYYMQASAAAPLLLMPAPMHCPLAVVMRPSAPLAWTQTPLR